MENSDNIDQHELHEVYADEEVINVRMRVKDYRILMRVIERERSWNIVFKYLVTIAGGILTFWAVFKSGIFSKLGV